MLSTFCLEHFQFEACLRFAQMHCDAQLQPCQARSKHVLCIPSLCNVCCCEAGSRAASTACCLLVMQLNTCSMLRIDVLDQLHRDHAGVAYKLQVAVFSQMLSHALTVFVAQAARLCCRKSAGGAATMRASLCPMTPAAMSSILIASNASSTTPGLPSCYGRSCWHKASCLQTWSA